MFNLIDIVHMKTGKPRNLIEEILSAATNETIRNIKEGNDVYWVGLCRFTWKQKAKTKKQAKEWTEYPYLAQGDKVRCVPEPELEEMSAKGGIVRMGKEDGKEEVVEIQKTNV